MKDERPYGLAAEFDGKEALVEAVRRLHGAGFRRMEAFSPLHVSELDEYLVGPAARVPWLFFLGGLVGCVGGFFMMTWSAVVDWRFNIGGRPYFSWPSFMPVTFEMAVLLAALTGFVGLLVLCGLPRLYHPMFHLPRFAGVTRHGFFLCVEAEDPCFDGDRIREILQDLPVGEVRDVPH